MDADEIEVLRGLLKAALAELKTVTADRDRLLAAQERWKSLAMYQTARTIAASPREPLYTVRGRQ